MFFSLLSVSFQLDTSLFRFCLQGVSIRQIRFRFDGQPINETDTPAQVGKSWISLVY